MGISTTAKANRSLHGVWTASEDKGCILHTKLKRILRVPLITLIWLARREIVTKVVQTVVHGESFSNQVLGELLLFLPHHNWLIKLYVATSMSSQGEHLPKTSKDNVSGWLNRSNTNKDKVSGWEKRSKTSKDTWIGEEISTSRCKS